MNICDPPTAPVGFRAPGARWWPVSRKPAKQETHNNEGDYEEDKIREAFSKAIDEMYDSARKFHKGQTVYTFEDPGWPCNPMVQKCQVKGAKIRKQGTAGVMTSYWLECPIGRSIGWVDEVRVFSTEEELKAFYLERLGIGAYDKREKAV